MRRALTLMLILAALPGDALAAEPLTNLSHLDFLSARVAPPRQAGHTTYRLAQRPRIRALWTYAEPSRGGRYKRLGGGERDPDTGRWTQGAYNTDDLARAAVVYIRHWRQTGARSSRRAAFGLLRTVTYMQTLSPGRRRGNFVLWMQPGGRLNRSAEPKEEPDPSDSADSYWLARSIWALGEGYAAFARDDPAFARFLRARMRLAIGAAERGALRRYGQRRQVDGLRLPAWLIADGADASAEAVYGLAAYVRASGDRRARRALRRLARGIALMRPRTDADRFPFGAILPWARSRSVWHAWGDQMAGALSDAGRVLDDPRLLRTARAEAGAFIPHALAQGGGEGGWTPAPSDRSQIAYGADALLQNLLRTARASRRGSFSRLAGIAAAWYFGNNPAGRRMYDRSTGRTFDGIEDGEVNRNSGAESTVHGLLSMMALDADPAVRRLARRARRVRHESWELVEAESGEVSGAAQVIEPDETDTGEGAFSGSGYVRLAPGGSVALTVRLAQRRRYRVLPAFWRARRPLRALGTRYSSGSLGVGSVWHGGAGARGVTPEPGFLDVRAASRGGTLLGPGPTPLAASYLGDGAPTDLDALLVEPEIERLLLSGRSGSQGLLRSSAATRRVVRLRLGSDRVEAFAYDARGRLRRRASGSRGRVAAPVEPGGFTYLRAARSAG